jgi:ribose/xylose/arabinose/galactoside ABC-type transport system permease subunit
MELVLLLLFVYLAISAERFLTLGNLLLVLRNVSMSGVIAFGMTMVIVSGEIDLSVGSGVAFAGCLTAYLTQSLSSAVPMPLAILISASVSIALGFGIGCATGFVRVRFRVPTFITTLAWMSVLRGAAKLISGGFSLTPFPEWYSFLGGGYIFGVIPFAALVFLAVFGGAHFLMNYTSFGRAMYAVGGNAEAARLSGINVRRVKILVMGIVAGLAALAGVMLSAELMSGRSTAGMGLELEVISAVIIGGTSLMGGVGRVRGTLMGVVFLGVLLNGMTLRNVKEDWQLVVMGALILAAVLVNRAQSGNK